MVVGDARLVSKLGQENAAHDNTHTAGRSAASCRLT